MADFFNPTTDFEPELPQYAQDIVEAAEAEEQLKQQQMAAQAAQMEEDVAAGEKAGPPSPEYDKGEPVQNTQEEPQQDKPESTNQNFLEYLQSGNSIAGNPLESFEDLSLPGQGVLDTVMDAASKLLPWLKSTDEWWETASGKKDQSPEDKFVRDVSAIVIPTLAIGGPVAGGLTSTAGRLGFTGLTTGGANLIGKVGIDMAVGTGIEALSDQTYEQGNLSDILNATLGIQTPWVTQDSTDPDVIYKKNMYEAAALGGVVGALDVAFGSGFFGNITKQAVKLFPKNKAASNAIKGSDLAPKISFKKKSDAIKPPTTMEAVAQNDLKRISAQDSEALERFRSRSDESPAPYDPFVNEPHEPQMRAIPDFNADPIKFKVDNARIQANAGTVNGRPNPAVTPGFKKAFGRAADGTDRSDLLEETAKGIDPQFDVMVGTQRLTSDQIEQAVDNLVTTALNQPQDFKEDFSRLVTATDDILGNSTKSLSETGFVVATGAYKRLLDMMSPRQARASAVIVTQSANNVSDASKAVSLIGDQVNSVRQQELVFDALRIMMPEIRLNQFISGKKLQLKKLIKSGDKTEINKFINDTNAVYDDQVVKTKQSVEEFLDTALQVSRENPEYLKPLLREFQRSNGEVDSIYKLSRLAEDKIGFWKKAFIDMNPEVPSLLVRQLQSARYNHILTGLAPVRAAAGAFTGLIGKPVTTFVGSALRGDSAGFKRAQFVYGGIKQSINRAFRNLADEYRFALENPDEALARGRKEFKDTTLLDVETMDEMAETWRQSGERGKVAVWNLTKWLSYYNKNNIVRFGLNSMSAIDGFTKSMSASMSSRARAYDELFESTQGAIDKDTFTALEGKLYKESFDDTGLLKDSAAVHTASELNLNMDSKLVDTFEQIMRSVPAAKAVFMFPRTGINAISLISTFSPTGLLGQSIGRARKIMKATTQAEIDDVLVTHGYVAGNNAAFNALKSEYKGREIMGGALVFAAAYSALNGNLTGSGPADDAERRRMIEMGWNPFSFKDWNGEWRSYQGLEPFDTFLGLVADVVYEGSRSDQAITEDFLRTIGHSITMNISNKTFLSGFEPLARMIGQDPSALTRFFAMQTDSMLPGTGVRSILSKAITPQLKDVQLTFIDYLKNRNKFMPGVGSSLYDMVDVYTGQPINFADPVTAAVNSILPFFKTNGGNEEWRQKLLATGWDGLQTPKTNPISGLPLTPEERNFVNNWIGNNYNLGRRVEEFLNKGDDWVERQVKAYAKKRGFKKQSEYPIKRIFVHEELTRIHNDAFRQGFAALVAQRTDLYNKGVLQKTTDTQLQQGLLGEANESAQTLINMPK